MTDAATRDDSHYIDLAAQLTAAWLGNPNVNVAADEVPAFLRSIHGTIGELAHPNDATATAAVEYIPAVPVRSSIKPDYIVSLIDGKKLKSLKRHLSVHGLTPQQYRERYGLKPDYPMVAASYSERRREVAKSLGLGKTMRSGKGAAAAKSAPAVVETAATAEGKPAGKTKAKSPVRRAREAGKSAQTASASTPAKRDRLTVKF